MTKCKPLECRRFTRLFNKFWNRIVRFKENPRAYAVDIFVVNCPKRKGTKCSHFQKYKGSHPIV